MSNLIHAQADHPENEDAARDTTRVWLQDFLYQKDWEIVREEHHPSGVPLLLVRNRRRQMGQGDAH